MNLYYPLSSYLDVIAKNNDCNDWGELVKKSHPEAIIAMEKLAKQKYEKQFEDIKPIKEAIREFSGVIAEYIKNKGRDNYIDDLYKTRVFNIEFAIACEASEETIQVLKENYKY